MINLKLSNEQKVAVKGTLDEDDFWFLMAGAGSGKTAVLARRVSYILENKLAHPDEILVLTYTNKAAGEMKKRILEEAIHPELDQMTIGTYHSVFNKILKEYGKEIGIKRYRHLQSSELKEKIEEILNKDEATYTDKDIEQYIKYMEMNKNYLISPKDIFLAIKDDIERSGSITEDRYIAYKVYKECTRHFFKKKKFDYQDLLVYTYELLKKSDAVKDKLIGQFKYILVDEVQDLNLAQIKILMKLKGDNNIMCIGDPRQAIYGFRGSVPSFIIKHKKYFKKSKKLDLSNNYRSSSNIVNAANAIIGGSKDRELKAVIQDMIPNKSEGDEIELHTCSSCASEGVYVVNKIKELVSSGYNLNDIAVIYRNGFIANPTIRALKEAKIPFVQSNEKSFWGAKEIKRIMSFFMLWDDQYTGVYLRDIAINVGLKTNDVKRIIEYSEENGCTIVEALRNIKMPRNIDKRKRLYKTLKSIEKHDVPTSAKMIIKEYDIVQECLDIPDERKSQKAVENLKLFMNIAKDYKNKPYDEFLEFVYLRKDDFEYKTTNAVNLITIHSAKGLEYKVVFLIGVEDGVLPHFTSKKSTAIAEEERRLFFVGITRAKEKLYISYARRRQVGGIQEKAMPSHFINDIDKYIVRTRETSKLFDTGAQSA